MLIHYYHMDKSYKITHECAEASVIRNTLQFDRPIGSRYRLNKMGLDLFRTDTSSGFTEMYSIHEDSKAFTAACVDFIIGRLENLKTDIKKAEIAIKGMRTDPLRPKDTEDRHMKLTLNDAIGFMENIQDGNYTVSDITIHDVNAISDHLLKYEKVLNMMDDCVNGKCDSSIKQVSKTHKALRTSGQGKYCYNHFS